MTGPAVVPVKEASDMSLGRAIVCIIFPPLSVIDRGCGTVLVVFAYLASQK